MTSIAIMTDTDASLPADLAEKQGIQLIPISINFGEEVYESGVDMDEPQLFARVDRDGKLPTTSAPPTGRFLQAFEEAFDAGAEQVACFCVSSAISGTYNAALAARDLIPEQAVEVIDTQNLSMGQGYMVLAASEAAQQGASMEQVIASAEDIRGRTHLFAALSTLKYLAMSGRIGHLAAGMADFLNVKPILTIRDGTLDMLERTRTQKKSWARVINLVRETSSTCAIERMAIVHVNAEDMARQFEGQLRAELPCPDEILFAPLTPGLAVHAGAGLVGAAFVLAPDA